MDELDQSSIHPLVSTSDNGVWKQILTTELASQLLVKLFGNSTKENMSFNVLQYFKNCTVSELETHCSLITIYAPMIYTAPRVRFLMRADR